jgi:hypothetical protein
MLRGGFGYAFKHTSCPQTTDYPRLTTDRRCTTVPL